MQNRVDWLDGIKGWGILFIVIGHIVGAGCHLATGSTQTFFITSYKYFYAFHVPLFFLLAGLTFREVAFVSFLKKKWVRLLVPYFVFALASIILYTALQEVSKALLTGSATTGFYANKTQELSFLNQCIGVLLGGMDSRAFTANSVLWFLPVLFSVESVAQLLSRVIKNRIWVWGFIGCGIFGVYALIAPIPNLPWGLHLVPKYLPYFIIGYLLGTRTWVSDKKQGWWLGGSIVGIVVFGYLAIINPWQYYSPAYWQYGVNFLLTLGCIAGWLLFAQCRTWKWLNLLGRYSLGIMLIHKFPVLFFQNLLPPVRKLFTLSIPIGILGTVIVTLASLVCCALAIWLFLRFCPWVLGEKTQKKSL